MGVNRIWNRIVRHFRREGFVAHHREIPSMIRKKQNGEA